jgi:type II secretory pathway pseudopilin PulG
MLVVAIIGLLAAIAIPKFGDAIIRSKEAAVRGQLGAFRSAISIYYADTEGVFPTVNGLNNDMPSLTIGYKYLNAIPRISIPTAKTHRTTNGVCSSVLLDWDCLGIGNDIAWGFDLLSGVLVVNCTHADSRGVVWSTQ